MTKAQKGDNNVNIVISEASGRAANTYVDYFFSLSVSSKVEHNNLPLSDLLITRGFPSILALPQRVLVAV